MQINSGYNTNRNLRTRSNGNRSGHGYNYRRLIVYCVVLNRERDTRKRPPAEMFASVRAAFDNYRKK